MILAPPLDGFWLKVAPQIERIRTRYAYTFTLQQVYDALLDKRAYLYTCSDLDNFYIVQPKIDKESGESILFVWLGGNLSGKRDENIEMLQELARGIGASRIEFESRRKGFEKVGFKISKIVYSMEVS